MTDVPTEGVAEEPTDVQARPVGNGADEVPFDDDAEAPLEYESDEFGDSGSDATRRTRPRRRARPRQLTSQDLIERFITTFRGLSERWTLIAIATLLSVGVGLIATITAPTVYEANALVRVYEGPGARDSTDPSSVQEATRDLAQTYAATLNSPSFISGIAPDVREGTVGPTELSQNVSAFALDETGLISVTVSDDSEQAAVTLATEVVDAFAAAIRENEVARSEAEQAAIRQQIDALDSQLANGPDTAAESARTELARRLSDAIVAGSTAGSNLGLSAPPQASDGPVSPRPLFNLIVALLVGLIIGVALTWVGRRLEPTA